MTLFENNVKVSGKQDKIFALLSIMKYVQELSRSNNYDDNFLLGAYTVIVSLLDEWKIALHSFLKLLRQSENRTDYRTDLFYIAKVYEQKNNFTAALGYHEMAAKLGHDDAMNCLRKVLPEDPISLNQVATDCRM